MFFLIKPLVFYPHWKSQQMSESVQLGISHYSRLPGALSSHHKWLKVAVNSCVSIRVGEQRSSLCCVGLFCLFVHSELLFLLCACVGADVFEAFPSCYLANLPPHLSYVTSRSKSFSWIWAFSCLSEPSTSGNSRVCEEGSSLLRVCLRIPISNCWSWCLNINASLELALVHRSYTLHSQTPHPPPGWGVF